MVYGLNVKPTQGYSVEYDVLDGDMTQVRLIDDTPDQGGKPPVMKSGRAMDPTHLPKRVRWKDRKKQPMADFNGGPMTSLSARAKDLIEQLEPGVHQFFPVTFYDIDGDLLEDRWFLNVCNRLDTIDRERVQGFLLLRGRLWRPIQDWLRDRPDEIPAGYDTTQPTRLVFNRLQIGGAHLWVDKHLSSGIWVSDEFDAAYDAAGLTGRKAERKWQETV
ncbi:imm11 family protein [Erythrobacter sp. WG]|uniref:imm11 family protein n=1 Tax=Erythrobacter sp. WG TaxID=2985510 RepID=UPI00226D6BA0|nr:DUF1629 domain-containing protein [Erythrobacter sp. WG]MCX9147460.1 hypothetical protein [Erythrobacter sp. WG]